MKAIVYTRYGSPDILQLKEIDKPSPKAGEVLVRVHATSVNAADWHLLRADPFFARFETGLLRPKFLVLGVDISGTVEAVGELVTHVKVGDPVFADSSDSGRGGFAEFTIVREDRLVPKPENLGFAEAAAVPLAAVTALQGLRYSGQIRSGESVLIQGASGGVGTFAVQIARALGAEVTAVCSTGNLELATRLGAHHVIDYRKEDFTKSGTKYDLILAANGYHTVREYHRALRPNGRYVMVGGQMKQIYGAMFLAPWFSMMGSKTMKLCVAKANQKDLLFVKEMIEEGKIIPVIDRRYPLAEVPEAIRYLEQGHARGKVVIEVVS